MAKSQQLEQLKIHDGKLPQDPGNQDCGWEWTRDHLTRCGTGRMDDVSRSDALAQ